MKILKDLRDRSGLTLREVSEKTSISNPYLSQLENGKIKRPSAHALYQLAKLYSVSIEMLLKESGLLNETEVQPVIMRPSIVERIEALEKKMKEVEFSSIVFNQ